MLDSWDYDVCGKGYNVRDAFDSWYERSNSETSSIPTADMEKLSEAGKRIISFHFSEAYIFSLCYALEYFILLRCL